MLKIAVTGVGGGCGQAILSALSQSGLSMKLYAIDITPISAGHYFYGVIPVVLPKPETGIEAWEQFVRSNGIDAIIPGSDHDLLPLAEHAERLKALVQPKRLVEIANDKAETASLMGIRTPNSSWGHLIDRTDFSGFKYPMVVKPRYGMTSRGVQIVHDCEELMFYVKRTTRPIVQEYIGGDEYTCALYFDRDSHYRFGIQMKRWLYAGTTYRAEVSHDPIVSAFMGTVADELAFLKPTGALNIQIKVQDGKAYLLEINARCSGSTNIRAAFGYNEPEMLIREFVLGQTLKAPTIIDGIAFRYWDTRVLHSVRFDQL